eukprot:1752871-Rhodomonas_salina.2
MQRSRYGGTGRRRTSVLRYYDRVGRMPDPPAAQYPLPGYPGTRYRGTRPTPGTIGSRCPSPAWKLSVLLTSFRPP